MKDNFVGELIGGQSIELLSVESTAEQMLKKIVNDFPSITELKKCESCSYIQKLSKHCILLEVKNNIQRINEMLTTMLEPNELEVYPCPVQNCKSFTTTSFEIQNPHLFIDLMPNYDFKNRYNSDIEVCVKAPLFEIPLSIEIQKTQYHLRGCVIFTVGENPQLSTIGHFVAMCHRSDNTWEIYDDMEQKPMICNPKTQVNIHLIIYSK